VGEHLELDTARLRESLREYQIPRMCVPAASLIDFAKRIGQPFPAELLAAYQSKLDEVHLVQAQRTTLRTLARGAD
jgi:hypothetical protein